MKTLTVVIIAVLAFAACSVLGMSEAAYRSELQRIESRLAAEVGEARADSVSQCAALLYGSKPCGGHWRSLVYSMVDGDQERIPILANEYTRLQDEMNRKFGIISDCALEPVPVPGLEDGRCVAAGYTGPDD